MLCSFRSPSDASLVWSYSLHLPWQNMHMWLVVHERCLTADNFERRGWPHNPTCVLCSSDKEDCTHLFLYCRYSQQIWLRLRRWSKATFPIPGISFRNTEDWWITARKLAPKNLRSDFDTITILMHWRIWKERNSRIFHQEAKPIGQSFWAHHRGPSFLEGCRLRSGYLSFFPFCHLCLVVRSSSPGWNLLRNCHLCTFFFYLIKFTASGLRKKYTHRNPLISQTKQIHDHILSVIFVASTSSEPFCRMDVVPEFVGCIYSSSLSSISIAPPTSSD